MCVGINTLGVVPWYTEEAGISPLGLNTKQDWIDFVARRIDRESFWGKLRFGSAAPGARWLLVGHVRDLKLLAEGAGLMGVARLENVQLLKDFSRPEEAEAIAEVTLYFTCDLRTLQQGFLRFPGDRRRPEALAPVRPEDLVLKFH